MPKLSIVITCLDDWVELEQTIASIRATAGTLPEIVVVDDGSRPNAPGNIGAVADAWSTLGDVRCRNHCRCGVGPSRTIGVLAATGEYVMLCDSHMRFLPGWYDALLSRIEGRPKTIHCATCLGIDSNNMNPLSPKGVYYGAKLVMFDSDPNAPGKSRILEGAWNKRPPEDDAQLGCLMGACYIMPRKWFLHLDAIRFLKSWGSDEAMLSLKCYLMGGDIRLLRHIQVAHKFLLSTEQQPFKVVPGHIAFNKLFLIHTLFSGQLRDYLLEKMMAVYGGGELSTGLRILADNWHLVEVEKARNKALFVRGIEWYSSQFGFGLERASLKAA